MIPEPCKYTPDVSFVNATFFNISAFVNSRKRCQPCFNGAQKRTAFKEMAHHFSSQNYKCCQKASFSLYWLAPGKTALCVAPSYVPLPADVSLHVGTQRETWSSQGCPEEGGGQSLMCPHSHPGQPDVEQEGVWGLMLPRPRSLPVAKRQPEGCTHLPRAGEQAKHTFPTGTDNAVWGNNMFSCSSCSCCLVLPKFRGDSAQGEASPLGDLSSCKKQTPPGLS